MPAIRPNYTRADGAWNAENAGHDFWLPGAFQMAARGRKLRQLQPVPTISNVGGRPGSTIGMPACFLPTAGEARVLAPAGDRRDLRSARSESGRSDHAMILRREGREPTVGRWSCDRQDADESVFC